MLTCIGAVLVDEVVKLEFALHPGASNPARWSQSLGGVAANVFRTARTRVPARLVAAVGDDANAALIRAAVNDQTDHLCVIPGCESGRYCAVLDQQGELVLGLAQTDVAERLAAEHLVTILESTSWLPDQGSAPITVIDANLSVSCIQTICQHTATSKIAALSVSPVKAMRLLSQAAAIELLLTNRREAAALVGRAITDDLAVLSDALVQTGFSRHVITDGAAALIVVDENQRESIDVPAIESARTVNGAGDALAGATLAHWSAGHSLTDSVAGPGLSAARAVMSGQSEAPALIVDKSNPGNP